MIWAGLRPLADLIASRTVERTPPYARRRAFGGRPRRPHLHQIPATSPEDKEITRMGIVIHHLLDLQGQAVHAPPHIGVADREPDSCRTRNWDHRACRRTPINTFRTVAGYPAGTSRRRPSGQVMTACRDGGIESSQASAVSPASTYRRPLSGSGAAAHPADYHSAARRSVCARRTSSSRPRGSGAPRARDRTRRERLRHQAALLLVPPATTRFFGGDNLDPLHQRSLQRNSIGASAVSSPISDQPARRPSPDGYQPPSA